MLPSPAETGELTVDEGTYAPYVLSVECSTRGNENLDEILAWLDGAGELILCTEPDKVFRASIYNKISVADMIYLYNSFLLQFRVQPFQIQRQGRRGCFRADCPDHHPQQRHSLQ